MKIIARLLEGKNQIMRCNREREIKERRVSAGYMNKRFLLGISFAMVGNFSNFENDETCRAEGELFIEVHGVIVLFIREYEFLIEIIYK